MYDNISQTVDSPSHHYENHHTDESFLTDDSQSTILQSSTSPTLRCFGQSRRLNGCLNNSRQEREDKKHKFWLNLLLAEEWNYFYLLKDKAQPYDEQEKHIKRIHDATKLSSILVVYLNSFVPRKFNSALSRTIYLSHYERLHCLFNSLVEVISHEHEYNLCLTIIERISYIVKKMKDPVHEELFIQFPSYIQRILVLSSKDSYQTLEIMSKDKQMMIERIPLYLILGINLQQNKHLLVLSVERQPIGSNSIHNFHFAHADRAVIDQWYHLLDKYAKQAKSDYMSKYQEYRI